MATRVENGFLVIDYDEADGHDCQIIAVDNIAHCYQSTGIGRTIIFLKQKWSNQNGDCAIRTKEYISVVVDALSAKPDLQEAATKIEFDPEERIERLPLEEFTTERLRAHHIDTLGQLMAFTENSIFSVVDSFGFMDIRARLAFRGLHLVPYVYPFTISKAECEMPIGGLTLTVRTVGCLQSENITTVGQLLMWAAADLIRVKLLGRKSMNEIIDVLSNCGWSLRA